jgi:hypothetical protein
MQIRDHHRRGDPIVGVLVAQLKVGKASPEETSARAVAPAVGAHTSRPALSRSTLPVMPGNTTATSAIGRIATPCAETNTSLALLEDDFKMPRHSS